MKTVLRFFAPISVFRNPCCAIEFTPMIHKFALILSRPARSARSFAVLLMLGVLWGIVATPATAQRGASQFERSALTIHTRAGGVHKFKIEIARTSKQMELGLMYRRRLAVDAGMLFVHDRAERVRMWMKNTYIPLDMLFVDADGRIIDLKQRTVPRSLAIIVSKKPVLAVFEVNAGTVSRLGIAIGDRLNHQAFTPSK